VFVVLSAARHRGFCSSAARPQKVETSRARQFFGMTGIGGAKCPLPEREQERPRLTERLSPAPPQVRCLSCRRAGAACTFARAASTCNYNGPFGDFFDQHKVADAVWDLFRDVFGIQKTSVQVVIGVASLPLGAPIGLDVIFEVAE
jgi:hypothetical protein